MVNIEYAQGLLNAHGFPAGAIDGVAGPRTRAATIRFQAATTYPHGRGGPLLPDGVIGERTYAALLELPKLSEHFTVAELRSKGDGTCYVRRELVMALETFRQAWGAQPVRILSAYRDPAHNRRVGGASRSQHVAGLAADILSPRPTLEQVRALRIWTGIGVNRRDGTIRHLDRRPGSPQRPTVWYY